MRKRRLLLAVFVALLDLVIVSFLIPAPDVPSKVTRENFDRIQHGMTDDEVTAILGPEGDYSGRHHGRFSSGGGYSLRRFWWGVQGEIFVEFEKDRSNPDRFGPWRVVDKTFSPLPPGSPRETYGERWYRQLGL
jgi:hypothetical protein